MGPKAFIKNLIPRRILDIRRAIGDTKPLSPRTCPICGFSGFFSTCGRPPRLDALCPKCGSLERHRLFWLWFSDQKILKEPIIHFAAEKILEEHFRKKYPQYKTADLFVEADLKLNMEKMDLDTGSIKTVICNHVLEHVDDKKALLEIYRVLSDDGLLIASVPIIEGWDTTYENEAASSAYLRELHFGQYDHVRYYGRDFRDRLKAAGFTNISEISADGDNVVKYSLVRGEKIFLCKKK